MSPIALPSSYSVSALLPFISTRLQSLLDPKPLLLFYAKILHQTH